MVKSKFLKVKKWINLDEAAHRLSVSLEEKVTTLDLLELGLDKELKISVKLPYSDKHVAREAWTKSQPLGDRLEKCFQLTLFTKNNPEIKKGTEEYQHLLNEYIESEFEKYVSENKNKVYYKDKLTIEYFKNEISYVDWEYSKDIFYLDENVFELEMVGGEVIDLMTMVEVNKNREPVELYSLDGVFIKSASGKVYNLQERFDNEEIKSFDHDFKDLWGEKYLNPKYYFPMASLPAHTEFGVKTDHLMEFESKLMQENNNYSPDDLLYVMGGVLNNVTSKAKKWTQGEIAIILSENGIKNLSERKINEIFSIANKEYKKIN